MSHDKEEFFTKLVCCPEEGTRIESNKGKRELGNKEYVYIGNKKEGKPSSHFEHADVVAASFPMKDDEEITIQDRETGEYIRTLTPVHNVKISKDTSITLRKKDYINLKGVHLSTHKNQTGEDYWIGGLLGGDQDESLKLLPLDLAITDNSKSINPDIWMQLAFHVLERSASRDPGPSHYTVARSTLESEEGVNFDSDAVDMLARALVKKCCEFNEIISKNWNPAHNASSPLNSLNSEKKTVLTPTLCQDETLWLDDLFLKFLERLGIWSAQNVKDCLNSARRDKYTEFIEGDSKDMSKAWGLWIPNKHPAMPPYLNILSLCIWHDLVKPKWKRRRKNTPAIAHAVFSPCIKELLSKDNKVVSDNSGVQLTASSGQVIASAQVAAIDPSLFLFIADGLKDMPALAGHKTYRWLIRQGWGNWINEHEDPRLIKTTGGYSGIAELVGCTRPADRKRIKTILHALAYGYFRLPHGSSGNMIALEIKDRARNGHPTAINIVLGTMLMPQFVCGLPANERKLIPVPELPPLVSDTSSWAAQAMFQLLLLEEFSKNSRELATTGTIHLPNSRMIELAGNAKLSHHTLPKVIDRWSREDGMLERDGELYTINKDQFGSELLFLTEQGNRSESQSKRAKRGIKKKSTQTKSKAKNV